MNTGNLHGSNQVNKNQRIIVFFRFVLFFFLFLSLSLSLSLSFSFSLFLSSPSLLLFWWPVCNSSVDGMVPTVASQCRDCFTGIFVFVSVFFALLWIFAFISSFHFICLFIQTGWWTPLKQLSPNKKTDFFLSSVFSHFSNTQFPTNCKWKRVVAPETIVFWLVRLGNLTTATNLVVGLQHS